MKRFDHISISVLDVLKAKQFAAVSIQSEHTQ